MRQQGGAYTNNPGCCENMLTSPIGVSPRWGGEDFLYDDQISGVPLCGSNTNLFKYWESMKVACSAGNTIVYAGYYFEESPSRGWELRATAILPVSFSLGVWFDMGVPQLRPVDTGDTTAATCRPNPGNLPHIQVMVTNPGVRP